MIRPRFIQIHTLHSYPAALLNRDDSGLAKRLPFGNAIRTRVSSQCLKRHWRVAQDAYSLRNIPGVTEALRSREIVTRRIMAPIRASNIADEDVIQTVEDAFQIGVYGPSGTSRNTRQPLLLGLPEIEYLQERATAICQEHAGDAETAGEAVEKLFKGQRNNFKVFREQASLPAGLESALFGRMVTSDPSANIEAAVHVAHAFTVHAEESENDYFSVVDDLQSADEEAGADHIGDIELTAGLFYGYVVVDIPGLVSNLEGQHPQDWEQADRQLAGKVVEHLLHLIATVSPGAKRGSTAPYTYADLMLVEAGERQPRSLSNAFRQPVRDAQTFTAVSALSNYLAKLDANYGINVSRRVLSVDGHTIPAAEPLGLDSIAAWASQGIVAGKIS